MTIRMLKATDQSKNALVDIKTVQQSNIHSRLHCEFCVALVSFVKGHLRGNVIVKPFFRLLKGQIHADSCRYNVRGRLTTIARETDDGLFADIGENRFELYLHVLQDQLEASRPDSVSQKFTRDSSSTVNATAGCLGAYINSANRVLKLRAICDDNTEIEDTLVLKFKGVTVPWSKFYFDDTNLYKCYSQLSKQSSMPVAICGKVKEVKQVDTKNGDYAILELKPLYLPSNDKLDVKTVQAGVWSSDLTAFVDYQPDQMIVAFGMWKAAPLKLEGTINENLKEKRFRNYKLNLWLVIPSQICQVDGE